ncbi:MAG: MarR family winged helix-turn-helix transcriptional regulator [Bacteroidota bacterium]
MEKDFLKGLGFTGVTARIKRISDNLLYDARMIYEESNLGIEPNWHLVFLLLKEEKQLTVTQIAQRLKFSHPAVIKITKKMKALGYLDSVTDSVDSRKQLLRLTEKSLKALPKFEQEWDRIQTLLQDVFDEDLLQKLSVIEARLEWEGIYHRYKKLDTKKRPKYD